MCTQVWGEAHNQEKNVPNTPFSLLKGDMSKKRAIGSTFPRQKHSKLMVLGQRLEVDMSKKCTRSRCKANLQVKKNV